MRPILFGAPRLSYLSFFAVCPSRASLRRSVWRSVVRLSAAGEGVFTDSGSDPQGLFLENVIFFSKTLIFVVFQ